MKSHRRKSVYVHVGHNMRVGVVGLEQVFSTRGVAQSLSTLHRQLRTALRTRFIGEVALARHFRLWSYSPNLMAGYPAGTRTEPMGAAPAVWFWICGGFFHELSPGQAAVLYKLLVFGLLAAVPPAMALAALWFGFD